MTYRDELEKQAKRGFEYFMIYIDEHSHLLTEVDEEDGNTVVEVTYWGDDEEEFIGRYYFNDNGEYLKMD